MYKAFYNLKRNPFEITPDPTFLFPTTRHNEALASLYYGVTAHRGFVVLTGEANGVRPNERLERSAMAIILANYVVPAAIIAVAVVLLLGLANMLRGGSANLSQKLMRWRVVLQFAAIVIIMFTVWVLHR